jgi:hypothetical protein
LTTRIESSRTSLAADVCSLPGSLRKPRKATIFLALHTAPPRTSPSAGCCALGERFRRTA